MKVEDTIDTFQKSRKENGGDWEIIFEKGKEYSEELTEGSVASGYSIHSSIESGLDEERGKLIARRMTMIPKETKEVEHRVDEQEVEKKRTATI